MAYDSRAIGNLILVLARQRGLPISNGKLQKLLFLAHAIFLVTKGKSLVHSSFEAWHYGPVNREVYEAFKEHGGQAIPSLAKRRNPASGEMSEIEVPADIEVADVVSRVVSHYGSWEFSRLIDLTHAKNGPWDYVVTNASARANVGLRISDEVIRERYRFLWKVLKEDHNGDWTEENHPFA